MALDAAMIRIAAEELNEKLSGARAEKIYMPSRDEVVLSMRTQQGRQLLFLSARSGAARAHITAEEFEYPATPPAFCMLLRKHLTGARLISVDTVEGDRVMLFHFDAVSEMGDRVHPMLSCEMMGRYSNLVLVDDDGCVLDAIKRIDDNQSDKRQLLPGVLFTEPPKPEGKLNFFAASAEEMVEAACCSSKAASAALLSAVSGLSPLLCREAALRLDDRDADTLTAEEKELFVQSVARIRQAVQMPAQRQFTIVYDGEKPVEFSFVPLLQYKGLRSETFADASALFDRYYSARDRQERMRTRSQDLNRQVHQLLERNRRRQEARREELADTAKAEDKKLCGELLTANLHAFKRGDKEVTVLDYYTGEMRTIKLDVTRGPNENAQRYYKEYRKLHTAADVLKRLLEEGDEEYRYLQQVEYAISEAATEEEFLDIRKELKDAGYLRGFRYKERSKRRSDPYLHYRTTAGYEVLVGRNNAANEKLSLKMAAAKDIWLHVKDAAGSHVVLRCEGEQPDDQSLTEACCIAAYHSSQRTGQLVAVDYTEARRVRKIPGGRVGMVTYTNQKTAYVTPDEAQVTALKSKK